MTSAPEPVRDDDNVRVRNPAPCATLLALLAPGIVHQLGNALFTIQGHAQLFAGDTRERDAILRATQRGADAVRLMGCLLGESAPTPTSADWLLTQIVELVRIGLRERGRQVQLLAGEGPCLVTVDLQGATQLLLLSLQQFLHALPEVSAGTVTLQRHGTGVGGLCVRIGFAPKEGQLPFPIVGAELLAAVAAAARSLGVRLVVRARGAELEVVLPALTGVPAGGAAASIAPTPDHTG